MMLTVSILINGQPLYTRSCFREEEGKYRVDKPILARPNRRRKSRNKEDFGMMTKDCTTCQNSYLKDFAYLICSINGLLDIKDVENSKNCKDYEECENE